MNGGGPRGAEGDVRRIRLSGPRVEGRRRGPFAGPGTAR
jgi:hypothetical protein